MECVAMENLEAVQAKVAPQERIANVERSALPEYYMSNEGRYIVCILYERP